MIQVLSKKAIQFRNPNKSLVNKAAKLGEPNQIQMTTKLEEAYCRVLPDVVTVVPDWVKTDPVFDWHVKDGTLMEIMTPVQSKGADLQARGQQQISDEEKKAAKKKAAEEKAALHEKLEAMTKQELLDYASEKHQMELSRS